MPVVQNAHDAAVGHVEANDAFWRPPLGVSLQPDDHWFAIHFAHRHSPGHRPALVVTEVGRVNQSTDETVCHAQASVDRDEFSEAVPITSIESLDAEM